MYSIFLYGISMFLPVFGFDFAFLGFHALMLGNIFVFSEFELFIGVPWLANIIYIINILLRKKVLVLRLNLSVLMLLMSLFSFGYLKLPTDLGGNSESLYIGPGLLVWIASFVFLLLDQVKEYKKTPR